MSCLSCKYAIYDNDTGTYICRREDDLTEADVEDLTETGGENCSQYRYDDTPDYDEYFKEG